VPKSERPLRFLSSAGTRGYTNCQTGKQEHLSACDVQAALSAVKAPEGLQAYPLLASGAPQSHAGMLGKGIYYSNWLMPEVG